METKEFENVKVVHIPALDILGVIEYESDDQRTMAIYSTEFNCFGDKELIVTQIVDNENLVYGVDEDRKSKIINELLERDFSFCVIREAVGRKILSEENDYRKDYLFGMHLRKIRDFINKNKNNNKSMETKKIFIPFYLEYVGVYSFKHHLERFEGLLFKKVDGTYAFVYKKEGSRSIHCREFAHNILFKECGRDDELVREIGKVIMSGDFSELEFKFFDVSSEGEMEHVLKPHYKNQYLLAILNCLDINFSHKNMITDKVSKLWDRVKSVDTIRFQDLYKNIVGIVSDRDLSISDTILEEQGRDLSEKIHIHFTNYSMKDKINIDNIGCVLDIETGICFAKLIVKERNYGGDFDLVGLKKKGDEEYSLVIREVPKIDFGTFKYRNLTDTEKTDFLIQLIDQDTNITSVLIQGNNGKIWERTETNDVDSYRNYIEAVVDKVLGCSNEEAEEERINREFNDDLVKIAELISKKIDEDYRKYITPKDNSLILYYLKTIIDHLKSLEPKD